MIDIDKYEGVKGSLVHSISNEEWEKLSPAAQALIADAPLLLDFIVWVKNTHPHYYYTLTKAYQSAKNNR